VGRKKYFAKLQPACEVIAFIMYINMLFRPIRQLAAVSNTLQMGMVGSERVFKVLDTKVATLNEGNIEAKNIKGESNLKMSGLLTMTKNGY